MTRLLLHSLQWLHWQPLVMIALAAMCTELALDRTTTSSMGVYAWTGLQTMTGKRYILYQQSFYQIQSNINNTSRPIPLSSNISHNSTAIREMMKEKSLFRKQDKWVKIIRAKDINLCNEGKFIMQDALLFSHNNRTQSFDLHTLASSQPLVGSRHQ